MNVLYINDELATSDGSNYHALGILKNLQKILGESNVHSYPAPVDGSAIQTEHSSLKLRERYKNLLQVIRIIRKTILSHTRSHKLAKELKASNWIPTHILARSVIFDTTAVLVARCFGAKLIYEVNTPMYYEHCVLNKLPFAKAIEHWEQRILNKSDYIYTVSTTCRDMLCNHYNLSPDKFFVIPNGYMEELYDFSPKAREEIRASIRTKERLDGKFVVTFIGSLKTWHGINQLCEIASQLEKENTIHFLVAGDGTEHSLIEDYCRSHSNMTYKGKLPLTEMTRYLFASDLGIMPYLPADNFYFSPLKMYDMIGAGLPFVGTDQGQIHEFCKEYLNDDFLLTNCSISDICQRILQISKDNVAYLAMKNKVSQAQPHITWHQRTYTLLQSIDSHL